MHSQHFVRWLGAALVTTTSVLGQACPIAVDVNTKSHAFSSNPREFCTWQGVGYFVATQAIAGDVIYRSDGTVQGTVVVHDPKPGRDFKITSLGVHGAGPNRGLWFTLWDDWDDDVELWFGDGMRFQRVATVERLGDTTIGSFGATILMAGKGELFAVTPGSRPTRLTHVRSETIEVAATTNSNALVLLGTQTSGQIWRTDGTPTGTTRLASFAGCPRDITPLNGRWVFGVGLAFNRTLWSTDGTTTGTYPLTATNRTMSYYAGSLGVMGNWIYFSNYRVGSGYQLWRSDGTDAGTHQFLDIKSNWRGIEPYGFFQRGGELWFTARTLESGTVALGTNGTPGHVRSVYDPSPGNDSARVHRIQSLGRDVVFGVAHSNRAEHHILSGRPPTVRIVPDPLDSRQQYRGALTLPNGRSIARGFDSNSGEFELLLRSGILTPPQWLDLEPEVTTDSSSPQHLTPVGRSLWFSAIDEKHGREPWIFANGAGCLVADLEPGEAGSNPSSFVGFVTAGELQTAFRTSPDRRTHDLWVSNGTAANTKKVPVNGNVTALMAASDCVYFTIGETQLFRTDGTSTGTWRIPISRSRVDLTMHTVWRDQLIFDVGDDDFWLTDGTPSGTTPWVHEGIKNAYDAQVVDDRLILHSGSGSYLADPASKSARQIRLGRLHLPVYPWTPVVDNIYVVQHSLYTRHYISVLDRDSLALMRFQHVKQLPRFGGSATIQNRIGQSMLISSGSPIYRYEPRSGRALELYPPSQNRNPTLRETEPAGSGAYAIVWPAESRPEYWFFGKSRGSSRQFCNGLRPPNRIEPALTKADGRIFFVADSPRHGRELHWIPEPKANVTDLGRNCGSGASIRCTDPVPGRMLRIRGLQLDGQRSGILLLGQAARTPEPAAWDRACLGWFDARHPAIALATLTGSRWSTQLMLPDALRLRGRQVALQAVFAPIRSGAPITGSNTLLLTLDGRY